MTFGYQSESGDTGHFAADDRPTIRLASQRSIRIGPVTVDPASRRVRHDDGREEILQPRAMQVLVLLLGNPGRVVGHDELVERCWNQRFVGDESISRALSRLRQSVATIADGVFRIETVPRVGYRLVACRPGDYSIEAKVSARPRLNIAAFPIFLGALVLAATMLSIIVLSARGSSREDQSLAVLTFESSPDHPRYLADGLAEQIRQALAQRTDLSLIGVMSSAMLPPGAAADKVRQRLRARYFLTGRIIRSSGGLEAFVELVDSRTEQRIWSERVAAPAKDPFLLHERVAANVASALNIALKSHRLQDRGRLSIDAHNMYLVARGLIRSREPARMEAARSLLSDIVKRNPRFAAAWSSLAVATFLSADLEQWEGWKAAERQALSYVRRALALDPQLAEGHGAIGMILGFNSPEALRRLELAARLDPNNAELQFWRGHAYGNNVDIANQLASYRRAAQLDPLWLRPVEAYVSLAARLGDRRSAEAEVGRFERVASRSDAHRLRGSLALARGDLSRAVLEYAQAEAVARGTNVADTEALAGMLRRLEYPDAARRIFRFSGPMWRLWYGPPPSLSVVRSYNARAPVGRNINFVRLGVKRLVIAKRAAELAPTYWSDRALVSISANNQHSRAQLIENAAIVALVLRQAGHRREADELLRRARYVVDGVVSGKTVPADLWAQAAEIYAASGDPDGAVSALRRAVKGGWRNWGPTYLTHLEQEPTFANLLGNRGFAQVADNLRRLRQVERNETRETLAGTRYTELLGRG